MRGLGSIPIVFFLFSCSKASAANIGIIAILVHFEKKLYCFGLPESYQKVFGSVPSKRPSTNLLTLTETSGSIFSHQLF